MSAQCEFKPFRLMDLPTELRLMIYKQLPRQIKHTELRYFGPRIYDPNVTVDSRVTLVTRHLPTAILRTSHQVYAESRAIVSAILQSFMVDSQPRIIGHDHRLDAVSAFVRLIVAEHRARTVSFSYHIIQPWNGD
jgi:hypothetical protein